jgi:putative transferase (TIGR04331 family)
MSHRRFLVTTAVEATWNRDRPILFLGEWCRRFLRRGVWSGLDATLQTYHWDDREKYFRDYQYLDGLYEDRLSHLSRCLGRMHGVTEDVRYWRIIIGPWLRFFTDALFDRFESVRTVVDSDQVDDTWVLQHDMTEWVPADFQEFYAQFTDDPWNHVVFAECIRAVGLPFTLRADRLRTNAKGRSSWDPIRASARFVFEMCARLWPSRFSRIAVVSAYIPHRKLLRFQRALGQLPYLISPVVEGGKRPVERQRRELLARHEAETPFERLLDNLIVDWIPLAYVEGFDGLRRAALSRFPRNPKVVFTSNAFQADEGFKVWAAHHALDGVPLVVGQHGGNMGIARCSQPEDHQARIADVFASWGWTSRSQPNVWPMPALKLVDRTVTCDRRGDILMTLASYPRYFYCHFSVPVGGQFLGYLQDQVRFATSLDSEFRGRLKIRIEADRFGWDIAERLREAGLGWAIDPARADLMSRLNRCRISVGTYNATVFLETLAANFPTLVFFDPRTFEVRPEAESMMDRIRQVGILHDTPESAARLLNTVGGDVVQWWNGADRQEARREFCDRYARVSTDWRNVWKSFLDSMASGRD